MPILSKRSAFAVNPIRDEDTAAEALVRKGRKVIKLSTGDPAVYMPTPAYIIDAYVDALKRRRTYYSRSEGAAELIEAIAGRYRRMYRLSLGEHDIITTQGLSEALYFMNSAMIDEKDYAVVFKPYYPAYISNLHMAGGNAVYERYDEERGWSINTDRLRDSINKVRKSGKGRRIKYMMITNPNNPTGTVLGRRTLEEIVEIAKDNGLFLVSDEIYDEIVFNGAKFTSVCELAGGIPHMVLNGASKNFDATGFRIGFAIIPEDDDASAALKEKFRDYARVRLSANTPSEYACAAALNNVKEHRRAIRRMVKEISGRINYAAKLLSENSYVSVVRPSGAFYLFPRLDLDTLRFGSDAEFCMKLLLNKNIQITRGSGFGDPGHIRIVCLAPKEILGYAIESINEFCSKNARR